MQQRDNSESVESLNALDLDIEALEQRLDMMHVFAPMGYTCGVDGTACGANNSCGSNAKPVQPVGN